MDTHTGEHQGEHNTCYTSIQRHAGTQVKAITYFIKLHHDLDIFKRITALEKSYKYATIKQRAEKLLLSANYTIYTQSNKVSM